MCGRYGRRADKQKIASWFHAHNTDVFYNDNNILPSYNIAPTDAQPVIRLGRETGERELAVMKWGLVPYWSKNGKAGYSTINARAETLTTAATYREAVKHRRCLIPAEWFYEWQRIDEKTKQPYAIALKEAEIFAFAGLWERWKDNATGQAVETYTIITTDPNELMQPFHDRMPAILHPNDYDRWLAPAEASRLPLDLLRPYPDEEMKIWRVGKEVGNVRNNFPRLVEAV